MDFLDREPTSVEKKQQTLAFTSKLNSLCRMTFEREMAALRAIDQIDRGEKPTDFCCWEEA